MHRTTTSNFVFTSNKLWLTKTCLLMDMIVLIFTLHTNMCLAI